MGVFKEGNNGHDDKPPGVWKPIIISGDIVDDATQRNVTNPLGASRES
jgi:hypothetical protein